MVWTCGDTKKAKKEYKISKNANLGGKPTFFSKKKRFAQTMELGV